MNAKVHLEKTISGFYLLMVNGVPVPVVNATAERLKVVGVPVVEKKPQTIGELLGGNMSDKNVLHPNA